ncbi:MAG: YiiX/YebB-like N1pC/P60 family cysteine hydrolase [Candidatus Caldatribacteriota bacterium]|nr:hypothetical protein [Patescibacteria group bacterium]
MNWYRIKSAIISWFADIRFYKGGLIVWGESSYKVKGPHMRKVLKSLQPGDVLLRRYSNYLGSVLIKGFWSHAAIYVGYNTVIHAVGEGIIEEDILTFMRCDSIEILRHPNLDIINNAIDKAIKMAGKNLEYDFNFTSGNDKYYCTEFVDECYNNCVSKFIKFKIIFPDDFEKCKEFEIIYTKK